MKVIKTNLYVHITTTS